METQAPVGMTLIVVAVEQVTLTKGLVGTLTHLQKECAQKDSADLDGRALVADEPMSAIDDTA